jgi:Protein of unknown function (DUF1239).
MTAFVVMLLSCENPISVVRDLASEDTLSSIIAEDIVFVRSDSGEVLVQLTAPRMLRQEGDSGALEFPKGFVANMYKNGKILSSRIMANYGKSASSGTVVEALGDVEVENFETQEKMNSEKLFWFQETRMIYTRSAVTITTPDKIIKGDSLTAKEDFSEYTIHNVNATIEVDNDENEQP